MKTKLLTLLAVIFCSGMAYAGGGFTFSAGPVNFAVGSRGYCPPIYCGPVARACYPFNYGYYYPQPIYYSWGPTVVSYSTTVSSPFSNGAAVPAPVIYQVPAPVIVTQPVTVHPGTFGWKR